MKWLKKTSLWNLEYKKKTIALTENLHDVLLLAPLGGMREKNMGLSNQNFRESDYSDKSGRFH